jgi:hypothetical protein
MGITMHATIAKEKPTSRVITITAATPKERRTKWLSKSSGSVNINSLLAEIDCPGNHLGNVLDALTSPMDTDLNNPCNPAPTTEKNNQITPYASPTGINQQTIITDGTTNNTGMEVSPQDNVLEALCLTAGRSTDKLGNTLDNLCILEPSADKDNQITPIASPTGVDTFTLGALSPVDNADPAANKDLQDQQTPSNRGALTTPAISSS